MCCNRDPEVERRIRRGRRRQVMWKVYTWGGPAPGWRSMFLCCRSDIPGGYDEPSIVQAPSTSYGMHGFRSRKAANAMAEWDNWLSLRRGSCSFRSTAVRCTYDKADVMAAGHWSDKMEDGSYPGTVVVRVMRIDDAGWQRLQQRPGGAAEYRHTPGNV